MKHLSLGLIKKGRFLLLLVSVSVLLNGCGSVPTTIAAVSLGTAIVNRVGESAERSSNGYNGKYPWFTEENKKNSSANTDSENLSIPSADEDPFGN